MKSNVSWSVHERLASCQAAYNKAEEALNLKFSDEKGNHKAAIGKTLNKKQTTGNAENQNV